MCTCTVSWKCTLKFSHPRSPASVYISIWPLNWRICRQTHLSVIILPIATARTHHVILLHCDGLLNVLLTTMPGIPKGILSRCGSGLRYCAYGCCSGRRSDRQRNWPARSFTGVLAARSGKINLANSVWQWLVGFKARHLVLFLLWSSFSLFWMTERAPSVRWRRRAASMTSLLKIRKPLAYHLFRHLLRCGFGLTFPASHKTSI